MIHADAILSPDSVYRYWLYRRWADGPTLLWVGVNPSVANATAEDHTARRFRFYATREGFGAYEAVNLAALISTDPAALKTHPDPVGPDNDEHITAAAGRADRVVCAWGATATVLGNRASDVSGLLTTAHPTLYCLGFTKAGYPRHPSRLGNDVPLVPFRRLVSS